jgi:hypothetical protein
VYQIFGEFALFNSGFYMFNSKLAALLIAGLATVGLAAQTGVARASVVYDLTLTPPQGGTIGGSGTITISALPLTGINQVSNYTQSAGTLLGLSISIDGDTFTLAQKNSGSNPLVQFITGALDDITYAGVAANGDSLQMTSDFVFTLKKTDAQETGSFSAVLDVAPAVPEPSTWAMMILGFCGLGFMAYRRKQNGTAVSVA